jgi:predicted transcriptional regulator
MSAKKGELAADTHEQLRVIADALYDIRRLLIYGLIRNGASQDQVAAALGTTQGTISKLLSVLKTTGKRRK